jgi:hypothetical protein
MDSDKCQFGSCGVFIDGSEVLASDTAALVKMDDTLTALLVDTSTLGAITNVQVYCSNIFNDGSVGLLKIKAAPARFDITNTCQIDSTIVTLDDDKWLAEIVVPDGISQIS